MRDIGAIWMATSSTFFATVKGIASLGGNPDGTAEQLRAVRNHDRRDMARAYQDRRSRRVRVMTEGYAAAGVADIAVSGGVRDRPG
jgi:hypothetical protein